MIIKQIEAVRAYQSLSILNQQRISSILLAKKIYELSRKLKPALDFQIQEEEKIYAEHPDFNPQIGGISITGKTQEERMAITEDIKKLNAELQTLSELDFEIDVEEPIKISLDQIENVKLSGEDIGNLEKIISFE